jgi:hypothetical protein
MSKTIRESAAPASGQRPRAAVRAPRIFDPGEVAIPRAYFGLKARRNDPPLEDL